MKQRRRDLGPAAVAFLRDDRRLSWSEIAHSLHASARTIRRTYARYHQSHVIEQDRRGRPYAELDAAEVVRLRDAGVNWSAIGRKLNASARTVRRAYDRALTTTPATTIQEKGRQKSAKAISENAADAISRPAQRTRATEPPRESWLMSAGGVQ